MTDINKIKITLEGKRLLGYMELTHKDYNKGDWDNAVAIYLGYPEDIDCYVLHCENQDYHMFDNWVIEKTSVIERDIRYKAIGEKINKVIDNDLSSNEWHSEKDVYQFEIITNTKTLKFGHCWVDCHYPNSIWDVI